MKQLGRTFLTGLIATIPIVFTLYIVYWLATTAEAALGGMIKAVLPNRWYWPGMGVVAGVGVIFLIGVLLRGVFFQRVFEWFESVFARLPLIKTLYNSIRDLMNFFSGSKTDQFSHVVTVALPDTPYQLLGFVTNQNVQSCGGTLGDGETVAVYLPFSYQIGGYTVLMPRSQLRTVDMPMKEAMRFALTAGITATKN